jgi:LppX/LprAFG-like lipoprotein
MAGSDPDEYGTPTRGFGFSPAYLQSMGAPEYLQADEFGPAASVAAGVRRRRRTWPVVPAIGVAAVVALLVVLATAGLRSERQNAATAAEVVAAAARQASHVKSVSATLSETVGSGGGLSATVQAQMDPARMSVSMRETFDGVSVPVSMLLADNTIYMKFGTAGGIPAGMLGRWIKVPLTGTGLGSILSGGQSSIAGENPASQAAMLAGARDVQVTGSQLVNGVQTTVYTGTLSAAAALKNLPASERTLLSPELRQIGGSIDFTAWIDSSNQVRKLAETETIAGHTLHVVFTVLAYNEPVHITIPSSSEIYSLPTGTNPVS